MSWSAATPSQTAPPMPIDNTHQTASAAKSRSRFRAAAGRHGSARRVELTGAERAPLCENIGPYSLSNLPYISWERGHNHPLPVTLGSYDAPERTFSLSQSSRCSLMTVSNRVKLIKSLSGSLLI